MQTWGQVSIFSSHSHIIHLLLLVSLSGGHCTIMFTRLNLIVMFLMAKNKPVWHLCAAEIIINVASNSKNNNNNDIISPSPSRQKLLDSTVCLDKTQLTSACLKTGTGTFTCSQWLICAGTLKVWFKKIRRQESEMCSGVMKGEFTPVVTMGRIPTHTRQQWVVKWLIKQQLGLFFKGRFMLHKYLRLPNRWQS